MKFMDVDELQKKIRVGQPEAWHSDSVHKYISSGRSRRLSEVKKSFHEEQI